MPIQLPNPPTDISNAVTYNKQILVSYETDVATKNDVGEGAIYQTAVIAQNAGGNVAPPWFEPALAAAFATGLAPLIRVAHITYNLLCGDGRSRPFRIVPFINGELPTAHPNNLPALVNAGSISALTGPQANAYLAGYNLPVPHSIAERKRAIRVEIGCTAKV